MDINAKKNNAIEKIDEKQATLDAIKNLVEHFTEWKQYSLCCDSDECGTFYRKYTEEEIQECRWYKSQNIQYDLYDELIDYLCKKANL